MSVATPASLAATEPPANPVQTCCNENATTHSPTPIDRLFWWYTQVSPEEIKKVIRCQQRVRILLAKKKRKQLRDRRHKRNNIVKEILDTEQRYVQSLAQLVSCYLAPLSTAPQLLKDQEIEVIFGNIHEIIAVNARLLEKLQSRLGDRNHNTRVGDVFLELIPNLLEVYTIYCTNYNKAISMYTERAEKRPAFQAFLREVQMQTKHDLPSFLIMPVQRIPRYQLLFEQLLKATDPEHVDYADLTATLEKMVAIAETANQRIHERQNAEKMKKIQKKLIGNVPNLAVPGRWFLHEGSLIKLCRKVPKRRWFFLFNDALVYGISMEAIGTTISYKFSRMLQIKKNSSVVDITDPTPFIPNGQNKDELQFAFQINTQTKSFVVFADSLKEKLMWIGAFQRALENCDSHGDSAPVWINDKAFQKCMLCGINFTFSRRRHHCRKCGKLVCGKCSQNQMFLSNLQKNVRVCYACFGGTTDAPSNAATAMSTAVDMSASDSTPPQSPRTSDQTVASTTADSNMASPLSASTPSTPGPTAPVSVPIAVPSNGSAALASPSSHKGWRNAVVRSRPSTTQLASTSTSQSVANPSAQILPVKQLLQVLGWLEFRDLVRASMVCKYWHRLARDDALWKALWTRVSNVAMSTASGPPSPATDRSPPSTPPAEPQRPRRGSFMKREQFMNRLTVSTRQLVVDHFKATARWKHARLGEAAVLRAHSGRVVAMATVGSEPTTTLLLSAGNDGVLKIWNLAQRVAVSTLHMTSAGLSTVAVSLETVATAATDGVVKVWDRTALCAATTDDVPTCCLATIAGDGAAVTVRYLLPRILAVAGGDDRCVKLYDIRSGGSVPLARLERHKYLVTAVSTDDMHGERLVSGDAGGIALLWDTRRLDTPLVVQKDRSLVPHAKKITAIQYDMATPRMATAGEDQALVVWDMPKEDLATRTVVSRGDTTYRALEYVASADWRLVAGGDDGMVRLWGWDARHQQYRLLNTLQPSALKDTAASAVNTEQKGTTAQAVPVATSGDKIAEEMAGSGSAKAKRKTPPPSPLAVRSIRLLAAQTTVISGHDDGGIRLWMATAQPKDSW